MNLVANRFVAARHDEDGVLVLSRFAGAASELRDALIVNPYNIEQTAEAIRAAIARSLEEKQPRMRRLRKVVRERNPFQWAADLVAALCEVRLRGGTEEAVVENVKSSPAGVASLFDRYRRNLLVRPSLLQAFNQVQVREILLEGRGLSFAIR